MRCSGGHAVLSTFYHPHLNTASVTPDCAYLPHSRNSCPALPLSRSSRACLATAAAGGPPRGKTPAHGAFRPGRETLLRSPFSPANGTATYPASRPPPAPLPSDARHASSCTDADDRRRPTKPKPSLATGGYKAEATAPVEPRLTAAAVVKERGVEEWRRRGRG